MNSSPRQNAEGSAIEIDQLSKQYPAQLERVRRFFRRPVKPPVQALTDISFTVRRGEIFGLIGRNGAGKTTLTKIIATLVQPTSGRVLVNGFDTVDHDRTVREQVGLATAEERSFYWRLTAEQNMMFFARLYGLTDRQARHRIIELFETLDLLDLSTRRFSELSTGNKQKLAVARALLANPPVLLLDEPTRSLDPLAAEQMRTLIEALATGGQPVSILLTSHNLAEIEQLCHRIAIISKGTIRAIGTPSELRASHRQNETVTLHVGGSTAERVGQTLAPIFAETNEHQGEIVVRFARELEDDRLDQALRLVQAVGGTVLSVEIERPTLLDVLGGLEQDEVENS